MERLQAALEKARATRGAPPRQPARSREKSRGEKSSRPEVWAELPLVDIDQDRLRRNRVVALGGAGEAVAFDLLRTKTLQQMRSHGWKRLAITSPGRACGKTTIAVNLAVSLARQPEISIILLDFDLRRPTVAKLLGARGERDCWQVLTGDAKFEEQAVRISDNVAVSLNFTPARNPAELLGSARTKEAIDAIEATYRPDVMLFDMPPMIGTDDNQAFMRNVDCAMLVAGAESTTGNQIDICERDLAEETNVLGVVLNKCRYMGSEPSYEYY